MATMRGDGSSIGAGVGPGDSGTIRQEGPDIPSGFAAGPSGTLRGGGAEIGSGFGPVPGTLTASLKPGDPIVINGTAYTFERVICKSTGEAEVFLLALRGMPCVFKLYYPNFKPKDEVLALLKQLRHEDIINVMDYGYFHDRFFEIMEYAEGGTLEQHLPIRDPQRLRKIVSETVNAFKFCHASGIIHKDIKPGNLYLKNADGTDIVIGDFGISSSLDTGMSRHLTSQSLTVGYAAPEMYGIGGKIYIGREVDYYALGITLIHLWQAKSPFDGLTIHAIANLTNSGAIKVPDDLPRDLQTLIRGLTTIDFAKRWGYDEVQRWLNGEDVPVHFYVKEIAYPSFQFGVREEAVSPEALASLLKAGPDKGKKHLYSGKISAWVNLFDHKLAAELDQIVEEEYPKDQDAGLQKAIYLLNPDEPFAQNGRECRTSEELAAALDNGFSFYENLLANPNHAFYVFLEAHEAQKEADTFRTYFKTFSATKALNTVILELFGRQSIMVLGQLFTTPDAVLRARDQPALVDMLRDPESRLSLWMEGAANQAVKSQLEAWRGLKICDATTLAYVSENGDGVPLIELSRNSFSFTDLKSRAVISDSFEIRNKGGGTLTGPIVVNKSWLRLAQGTIDSSRKTQSISFSIDTTGLAFGATDTAVVEIQSNVGIETVSVAIAVELGIKAAGRFRVLATLGAGSLGGLLGLAIHGASSMASIDDPSNLAGLVAVVGLAIEAWAVARKSGKPSLRRGLIALVSGLLVFGFLQLNLPLIYSVSSWALLFMVVAYGIAPSILVVTQTARNPAAVPLGVLVGAVTLSAGMVLGDMQVSKWIAQGSRNGIQGRQAVEQSGLSRPVPSDRAAPRSIADAAQHIVDSIRGAYLSSGPSNTMKRDTAAAVLTAVRPQGKAVDANTQLVRGMPSPGSDTNNEAQQQKAAEVDASKPLPMAVDAATGCHVWKPNSQPSESVKWSGGCENTLADGPGKAEWALNGISSLTYEGTFKGGMLQGPGSMIAVGGDRYDGEYRDGQREGRGTYVAVSGERYEGEWRNNKREGRGVLVYANGDRYEGDFRDNKRDGQGTYTKADGEQYQGEYTADRREGRGVLLRADGSRYEGLFKDGRPLEVAPQTPATDALREAAVPQPEPTKTPVPHLAPPTSIPQVESAKAPAPHLEPPKPIPQVEPSKSPVSPLAVPRPPPAVQSRFPTAGLQQQRQQQLPPQRALQEQRSPQTGQQRPIQEQHSPQQAQQRVLQEQQHQQQAQQRVLQEQQRQQQQAQQRALQEQQRQMAQERAREEKLRQQQLQQQRAQ